MVYLNGDVVLKSVNNDFDESLFSEIGKIVVAFGRIEYVLYTCLKTFAGEEFHPGMTRAIRDHRQVISACRELRNLAQSHQDIDWTISFSKLIDRVESLNEQRNDIVHALWTSENHEPLRVRPYYDKAGGALDWGKSTQIPLHQLCALRQEMEACYRDLKRAKDSWKAVASTAPHPPLNLSSTVVSAVVTRPPTD